MGCKNCFDDLVLNLNDSYHYLSARNFIGFRCCRLDILFVLSSRSPLRRVVKTNKKWKFVFFYLSKLLMFKYFLLLLLEQMATQFFSLLYFFRTSQATFSRIRSSFLSDHSCFNLEVYLVASIKYFATYKGLLAEWAVYLVMNRKVKYSNPGGVTLFSNRLLFESNSSEISRFLFSR